MNESIKKYAPKISTKFQNMEEDTIYRNAKIEDYAKRETALEKEINDLNNKARQLKGSAKDTAFTKIEELTIKQMGLIQLKENIGKKDPKVEALDILESYNQDKPSIAHRIAELNGKESELQAKMSKVIDDLEEERRGVTQERDELNKFERTTKKKVREMLQSAGLSEEEIRQIVR